MDGTRCSAGGRRAPTPPPALARRARARAPARRRQSALPGAADGDRRRRRVRQVDAAGPGDPRQPRRPSGHRRLAVVRAGRLRCRPPGVGDRRRPRSGQRPRRTDRTGPRCGRSARPDRRVRRDRRRPRAAAAVDGGRAARRARRPAAAARPPRARRPNRAADPARRCAAPPARWSTSGSTSWPSPPTEVDALARSLGRDAAQRASGSDGFAGWPSLVRLALSAPDGSAPQFLWEEIVAGLSAAEQRLLLALATLGWGTASDVAWVAGSGDGGSDPLVDARLESLAARCPAGQWRRRRLVPRPPPVGGGGRADLPRRRPRRHPTAGPRAVPAASGDVAHRLERAAVGRRRGPAGGLPSTRPRHRRRLAGRHGGALAGRRPRGGPRPRRTCACSRSPSATPATTTTRASTASSTP